MSKLPPNLPDCTIFLLAKAYQKAHGDFKKKLKPFKLTNIQHLVLEALWFQEGFTAAALGKFLVLDKATLSGVLDRLAARQSPSKIIAVTDPQYWLPHVSATFHGRDIMAPVAARLSLGLRPDMLGPAQQQLVPLQWPEVRILADRIEGEIVAVDTFGNLITNITREMLAGVPVDDSVTISCDEHETVGIFTTYADQPEMTLIALVGSSGQLELAIVNDSAAVMLGVGEGTKVTVCW